MSEFCLEVCQNAVSLRLKPLFTVNNQLTTLKMRVLRGGNEFKILKNIGVFVMKKIIVGLLFLLIQSGQAVTKPVNVVAELPTIILDDSMAEEQKFYGCLFYKSYGEDILSSAIEENKTIAEAVEFFLFGMFDNIFWLSKNDKHRLFLAEHIYLITNKEYVNHPHRKTLVEYGIAFIDYCRTLP